MARTLHFKRSEQVMKNLVFDYSKNENWFAIMVSILCLHKSLCSIDISSCMTENVSRIYLAALLYHIGHLQCAVHLCYEVEKGFKENDHCGEVRNLKLNCLLFMDDLATISGFLLLRRKILRIRNNRIFLLNPQLFVRYLFIQRNLERLEIKETFRVTFLFEADCCLAAMMRYKILRRFDIKVSKTLVYQRCKEDAEESAKCRPSARITIEPG